MKAFKWRKKSTTDVDRDDLPEKGNTGEGGPLLNILVINKIKLGRNREDMYEF